MRQVHRVLLLSLIMAPIQSVAADGYVVSEKDPCVYENGEPVSGTLEMINCAVNYQSTQENKLRTIWECLKKNYSPKDSGGYEALLIEQEAWESFYKKACHYYTYDFGREGHIDFQGCKTGLLKARAEYLDQVLVPEHDNACMDKIK